MHDFLTIERRDPPPRPVKERIRDFHEFETHLPDEELLRQARRCLDCGVPFCHGFACPLPNRVPDANYLLSLGRWEKALEVLHSANNFPEITGRVCPAACEAACTLSISFPAVAIRQIELQAAERGFKEGWVRPRPAAAKTGKRVAIVGSGPAGLAAAQELARKGHAPVVFEKAPKAGGLLRYGIPDFKLEKWVLDRRLEQLSAEGVILEKGVEAGVDISGRYLRRSFDAILISAGSGVPRDLKIPGRELKGIHFALDFLSLQNRRVGGESLPSGEAFSPRDKDVLVIGGGDTGADCVGTARRCGAKMIVQVEVLPRPPDSRLPSNPWPNWPLVLRSSHSHEEGCERFWSIAVKEFVGKGAVRAVRCARLEYPEGGGSPREVPGSEFEVPAGLVLIAAGFLHVEHGLLISDLALALDSRGNLRAGTGGETSVSGVFAAGDCFAGASLVASAIASGRRAAASVHAYLGKS